MWGGGDIPDVHVLHSLVEGAGRRSWQQRSTSASWGLHVQVRSPLKSVFSEFQGSRNSSNMGFCDFHF
jgi:hypothetical protein